MSEQFLRREQACEFLAGLGIPVTATTLATWAVRGGGPPFCKFGRTVLYPKAALLKWTKERLGRTYANTSDYFAERRMDLRGIRVKPETMAALLNGHGR